jgi:hypothetical protein
MPTFDKADMSNFRSYGGIDFLNEMKRKRITMPVIIITQYNIFGEGDKQTSVEEINNSCKLNYINYQGVIRYSQETWKKELSDYIKNILSL